MKSPILISTSALAAAALLWFPSPFTLGAESTPTPSGSSDAGKGTTTPVVTPIYKPPTRGAPGGRVGGGEMLFELLAHEHPVGADIDDAALFEQTSDQFLDFGVNEGFAAADGNHRGIALRGRAEAILEGHHVLKAGRVLANTSAASAREVAGVQRFELKDECKSWGTPHFVLDNVAGDFHR